MVNGVYTIPFGDIGSYHKEEPIGIATNIALMKKVPSDRKST